MIGPFRETVNRLFADLKKKQLPQSKGFTLMLSNQAAVEGLVNSRRILAQRIVGEGRIRRLHTGNPATPPALSRSPDCQDASLEKELEGELNLARRERLEYLPKEGIREETGRDNCIVCKLAKTGKVRGE